MPMFDSKIETMQRTPLRNMQLDRLKKTIVHTYNNVSYYRNKFDELGLEPGDIQTLEDIRKLPLTDKSALRETYPFGMFAVPLDDVVRIHSSSGTTGKPIVVGYTRKDLAMWTSLTARVAAMAGVTSADRVDMSFLYGLFTGGWGMHYGIEELGATIIPAGAGNTERHLMMMHDFGTTVLVSTASYACFLAEAGEKMGVDFSKLPLRLGLFGGEPCSDKLKEEIESRLHIRATDNYGLTELMGPGVAGECEEACGLHIAEDHVLAELVDPLTGEPVASGQAGELILTPLTKEAFPVLRYRTHDLTKLHYEPCACGRTHVRMEKVRQRTDDMLIIRGVNVFPSQIEDVLFSVEGTKPHYLIVVDRVSHMDSVEIRLEVDEALMGDRLASLESAKKKLGERLQSVVGIRAKITLVEPGTIERTQGKAKRVLDLRIH